MNKLFTLALGPIVALGVATWVVGCGSDSKEQPRPSKTLTYTDNLAGGGPGYVDVYEPPAAVDSSSSSSSSSSSGSSSSSNSSSASGRPAIIAIHGGAWRSGGRWQVAPVAAEFASHGYVVFAPDYSLAPHVKWPAPLVDLQTLLRYMRSNSSTLGIDPERIGAWGGSAGGHLATMLALHDDPIVSQPTSTTSSSGSGSGTTTTTTSGGSGSWTTTTSGSGSGSGGQTTSTNPPPLQEIIVTSGRVRCAVDAFGPRT